MGIREQVQEFHRGVVCKTDPTAPCVPSDAVVRLRAALIAEEFFETMTAMFALDFVEEKEDTLRICDQSPIRVNMAELADGMADLDYVVEGTRLAFGIDGGPVAAEVHRANMTKAGGPIAENGKRLKPPGFTPPDIDGVLRKQGWM
jgi:predicted HAD superfamily Cof-like phosphohydrolase